MTKLLAVVSIALALNVAPQSALQANRVGGGNPGAGIDTDAHSASVFKDGFAFMQCMRDSMELTADKHGEHRHTYTNTANVSVIRYTDSLDREKRQKMTHQVCFNFCKTVPEMLFFGLMNGRECYCAPYVQRVPGDGVCNLPCEGDSAEMCGGKEMSGVFEMHACNDAAETLATAASEGGSAAGSAGNAAGAASSTSSDLEGQANLLMTTATEGGDMASNAFGQKAKAYAAEVLHAGEAAQRAADALSEVVSTAEALDGADMSVPENSDKAIELEKELKKLVTEAGAAKNAAEKTTRGASPTVGSSEEELRVSARLFTPILPKVEEWLGHRNHVVNRLALQSTCDGDLAGPPIVGLTAAQCSDACDRHASPHEDNYCVAFNHFEFREGSHLCFLLKSVTEIWKYNCDAGTEWGDPEASCTAGGAFTDKVPEGQDEWRDSWGDTCLSWYVPVTNDCHPDEAGLYMPDNGEAADTACCICPGYNAENGVALTKVGSNHSTTKSFLQKSAKKAQWNVQNVCQGRSAWLIAAPVKPALQVLDRCFGMQMEGTEV